MFFDQLPKEVIEKELAETFQNRILETSPKKRFFKYNQIIDQSNFVLIYRGYDSSTGREILWNIVNLSTISMKEAEHFIKTLKKLKSFNNPHVIKYIDYWTNTHKKQLIYITQYMNGGTLKQYLKKIKKPKLNIVKGWGYNVLQAITSLSDSYLSLNIFLNCSNIYINSNTNQIKLGLQCFAAYQKLLSDPTNIPWVAPQCFQNQNNLETAVYSFGMTLLEIVTNLNPYSQCKNFIDMTKAILWKAKPGILKRMANSQLKKLIMSCIANKKQRMSFQQLYKSQFWKVQTKDNLPIEINQKIKQQTQCSFSNNLEVTKIAQITHKSSNHSSYKSLQNQFEAEFNYKTENNKNFKIKISSIENQRFQFQDFVLFFINKLDVKQNVIGLKTDNAENKQQISHTLLAIKNSFIQKYKQYSSQIENLIGEAQTHETLFAKKIEMQLKQIVNLQKDLESKIIQKVSKNKKSNFGLDLFDIINFNLSTVEVKELKKGLSSNNDILNFSCSSIYPENQSQKSQDFELDLQKISIANSNISLQARPHHNDFEDDSCKISSQGNLRLSKLKSFQSTKSQKTSFNPPVDQPKQ